jgi:hypothetical protein
MNIKLLNTYAIAVLMAIFMTACGGSGNGGDKDKVITEVPDELSDNQKVKEYFETLDLMIDEYVMMIEKIAATGQNVENKGEEPSFSDAMSMITDLASSSMKMAPLLEKMEQLEKDAEIMKEEMTPEEVEAFSKTYAKMMVRYYEMGKKLEANK